MARRLVFSINSGRVGSEYLARVLDTAADAVAFHEPHPTMTGPVLHQVMDQPLAASAPQRAQKVLAIRQALAAHPGSTYVETSHMFIKTFHDVVCEAFAPDDLRVVLLRRSLVPTLASFVRMGYFTDRNAAWPAWMHSAWTRGAVEQPPLALEDADQVDRCLAYLLDIEARAQAFVRAHPRVPVVPVRLESLQTPDAVAALFADLGLQPTAATDAAVGHRVNARKERKQQIGIAVDESTLQERIEAYLARYDACGRPRPSLPQYRPDVQPPRPAAAVEVRARPPAPAPASGLRIAHVVNPVDVTPASDLWVAQPVTFEAMRRARDVARASGHRVDLLATGTSSDRAAAPADFTWTGDLRRTGRDLAAFEVDRPLPVLRDLLDGLRTVPDADLYIYSNVDIAPLPHFYDAVAALHRAGHDALVINRRTIPDTYTSPDELPLMYAELGETHPGHDCFVFTPEILERSDLGDVVVGINWVGRALIWNLAMHARRFRELTDAHLTFHIGDSRTWQDPRFADWRRFNQAQAEGVLSRLLATRRLTSSMAIVPYLDDLGLVRR